MHSELTASGRVRLGLSVGPETFHRLRRPAVLSGTSANEHCDRAIRQQIARWIEQELVLVSPLGDTSTKAAGEQFPARAGDTPRGFNRDLSRDVAPGELVRVTVRLEPDLVDAWTDAVWHQHDTYPYLSYAFEAAVLAYLEAAGA